MSDTEATQQTPADASTYRDLTEHPEVAENERNETRICELCTEPIPGGKEGVLDHLQDHDAEEIAQEVSRTWTPDEPLTFHHPNGTSHFIGGDGYHSSAMNTACGRHFTLDELPDDVESIFALTNYDYADEDAYCQSCVNQYTRRFGSVATLPKPLEDEETEVSD